MHVPRALLLVLLLAGCGGSGSSGFDASLPEATLIDRAIAEQRCQSGDGGLTICPSGAAVANPIGGMPGPSELRVAATLAGDGMVHCASGGASCSLEVAVATEGLASGAELRLAVRALPAGAWQVGPPLDVRVQAGGMGMVAPVTVDGADTQGSDAALQVAVLVFDPPPAALPAAVDELRTTGASYAFVLPPVPVSGGAAS